MDTKILLALCEENGLDYQRFRVSETAKVSDTLRTIVKRESYFRITDSRTGKHVGSLSYDRLISMSYGELEQHVIECKMQAMFE